MLDPRRPFLISPPFGAWLRHRRAYSVYGSYTRHARPGSRLAQAMRTVRPHWVPEESWVNKIGLRNPGLNSIWAPTWEPHKIASIAMVEGTMLEWEAIIDFLWNGGGVYLHTVEINVSCPNTEHALPSIPSDSQMKRLLNRGDDFKLDVIWKLPPVEGSIAAAMRLADSGAQYIHLSNTLPSPVGGISGAPLREVNLRLVHEICDRLVNAGLKRSFASAGDSGMLQVEVIAGGGIYSPRHLRQYQDAGATRFSLATAWFWPPRALRIMRLV